MVASVHPWEGATPGASCEAVSRHDDVAVGNDLDSALVANRRGHDEAAASRPWHGGEESRPYDAWAESPGTSEASRDGEEGSHP